MLNQTPHIQDTTRRLTRLSKSELNEEKKKKMAPMQRERAAIVCRAIRVGVHGTGFTHDSPGRLGGEPAAFPSVAFECVCVCERCACALGE